jgi:hypothetical protein
MALKKLPVGIENFEEIRTQDFYYVDKTNFIIELLHNWGAANLFTRPRRFGKSLNMNMLKTFFEIGCKKELFDGLKISQEKELCEEYMGRYPVISISLKDVSGSSFEAALNSLKYVVGTEARRFLFLTESEQLTDIEKKLYAALTTVNDDGTFSMSNAILENSLLELSMLLSKHYGRQVIILIDEYDAPLDKAFQAGYYNEMVLLIHNLLSSALKTNLYLQFAVLTGCLIMREESIFTGLNNINVMSITDMRFSDAFGFTEQEVEQLLEYYGLQEHYDEIKAWYNGYQFGKTSVYCPWDVINHCDNLCADSNAIPESYWVNTSGNTLVRSFIDKSTAQTRKELEQLIAGESVVKPVRQGFTYSELDHSIENRWSVLFITGYLTQSRRVDGNGYELKIPNQEIRELFVREIEQSFWDMVQKDTLKLDAFCDAFPAGDAATIENLLNDYLWNTISVRDTAVTKERKENFYHGILLGLLRHKENWLVLSNGKSEEEYLDILVEVPESRTGVVIGLRYAEPDKMENSCAEALAQINEKQYNAHFVMDGMQTVIKYGIACFRKYCKVVRE